MRGRQDANYQSGEGVLNVPVSLSWAVVGLWLPWYWREPWFNVDFR